MSGGHFNGQEFQFQYVAETMANDEDFKKDMPRFSPLIVAIGNALYEIICDYDSHINDDTHIENMAAFEKEAIEKITAIITGGDNA